jgi:galactose mutarotase-like enzyme
MALETLQHGLRVFRLTAADGRAHAEIVPELGGLVASLQLPGPDGRPGECLFRHPWFWEPGTPETRGGIPLLFPVCGRLLQEDRPGLYRVDGQAYVLPIHGFAMRQPWEVAAADRPDGLRLRLADSPATRAAYPFAFELELAFDLAPEEFTGRLTVRNPGAVPLPYAAGFHPYFATPAPGRGKEETRVEARPAALCLYNATKTAVTGQAPPPAFPRSIAGGEINSLLLDMGGASETRLRFPDGSGIGLRASGLFRYRQFYTRPEAPFFCDEPWMAPPGLLNHPESARTLAAGQAESGTCRIRRLPCNSNG